MELEHIQDFHRLNALPFVQQVQVGELSRRPSRMRKRDMNCVADVLASVMDERFGKIRGYSDGEGFTDEEDSTDDDDDDWSNSD